MAEQETRLKKRRPVNGTEKKAEAVKETEEVEDSEVEVASEEVAIREEAGLPEVISFEEDSGGGFEHVTSKDFRIPIVRVLQAKSPETDEDDPKYVKEAKQGSIYNISTKLVYSGKEGIWIIPVTYFRKWVEFIPRDSGGGYVDEYEPNHKIIKTGKKMGKGTSLVLPSGNELIETGYFPSLHITEIGIEQIVITVSSSGWDFARDWLAILRSRAKVGKNGKKYTPAFYSHKYRVCTETKKNPQFTWKGFRIGEYIVLDGKEDVELYYAAKEFNRQMNMDDKFGSEREDASTEDLAEETAF